MVQIQSFYPLQAAAFLAQHPQALFADVRSSMEFLFVGHPVGAVNVAWIDEPEWDINPRFAEEILVYVQRKAKDPNPHSVPVVLICRSGVRSLEAGHALLRAGFSQVYNVEEGFEGELDDKHQRGNLGGWRFHGLAWEQC